MPEGPALHADPFVGTVAFLSLVFDEELVVSRVQYSTLLRAPCMSSLSKRACQSARYGISGTNQPRLGCSGQHPRV